MQQYVNEREKNARAQTSIKVLQMRPHFIYNTMASIYYLCEQNPKKAMFVEFDTPHMNFRIPPLTLQPIIENSIKYGVDPELEPLYISVQTKETENGSEIIVIDNGPGFDGNNDAISDNREPHIAINNIRERLSMMCSGTISFSIREEGGTVVRIWIPD